MNVCVPFICLALGAAINWRGLPQPALKAFDRLMNLALVVLMLVIGLNIGISDAVMENLGRIGLRCLLISLAAVWCSVGLVWCCEKTVMPLERIPSPAGPASRAALTDRTRPEPGNRPTAVPSKGVCRGFL